jgi:hypothetical protein
MSIGKIIGTVNADELTTRYSAGRLDKNMVFAAIGTCHICLR